MRTFENIAAVAESVHEVLSTSIHRRSQQLNISEKKLRRILHKNLRMTPYAKVHFFQELKPIDHPMRFRFAKWAGDRLADFNKKKNIFFDEAHVDLYGQVNKQNCRIWGTENPHVYIEKPTHSKLVTA